MFSDEIPDIGPVSLGIETLKWLGTPWLIIVTVTTLLGMKDWRSLSLWLADRAATISNSSLSSRPRTKQTFLLIACAEAICVSSTYSLVQLGQIWFSRAHPGARAYADGIPFQTSTVVQQAITLEFWNDPARNAAITVIVAFVSINILAISVRPRAFSALGLIIAVISLLAATAGAVHLVLGIMVFSTRSSYEPQQSAIYFIAAGLLFVAAFSAWKSMALAHRFLTHAIDNDFYSPHR